MGDEPEPILDCGDNSCMFAEKRGGMRTNGGCRCLKEIDSDPAKRRHVTAAIKKLIADRAALRSLLDSERLKRPKVKR